MADVFYTPILPHINGPRGPAILARFWDKVDLRGPDDCWLWKAGLNATGYGRFKLVSYHMAHTNRVALVIGSGEDHADLQALHSCDVRACCNPAHLRWGTHQDNMDDMRKRGRHVTVDQSGANNGSAKIDDAQLAEIVGRLQAGWSNKQIARTVPITHSMVSLIRVGKMWRRQSEALGWIPKPVFVRRTQAPTP